MTDKPTVLVHITDTDTGEVYSGVSDLWYDDRECAEFLWSDGAFACDCNRGHAVEWFGGKADPDRGCHDDRYAARVTTLDGALLYEDDPEFFKPRRERAGPYASTNLNDALLTSMAAEPEPPRM